MSTFFGGETLVEVKTVNGSGSASGTLYTVPSNRYADVWVQSISRPAVGFPISAIFQIGTSSYGDNGTTSAFSFQNFNATLFQGQSINISLSSGSPYSYYFVIREYSIP